MDMKPSAPCRPADQIDRVSVSWPPEDQGATVASARAHAPIRIDMPCLGPTTDMAACSLSPHVTFHNLCHSPSSAAKTAAIMANTERNLSNSGVIIVDLNSSAIKHIQRCT